MFQPIVAPYRIDLVNKLAETYDMKLCLLLKNLKTQKFNIEELYRQRLNIVPNYLLDKKHILGIDVPSQIYDAISTFNPDVVLVWEYGIVTWQVILYRIFHNAKYKIISLVDDSYDMLVSKRFISQRHRISMRLAMPFLDKVINVEPRATEWYKLKYNKGFFFPIVGDDNYYRKRLEQVLPISQEYVAKYNLKGKKVLLFVGRLVPEKNISTAINAYKKAKRNNTVFIIIGDGIEKEKLSAIADGDSSILMPGRYEGDELYAWYNVANVFILPSMIEPFGAVTNEALLAGCYSLISKHAGSSCLISENSNGNLIDPFDEGDITEKINIAFNSTTGIETPLCVKHNYMGKSFENYFNGLNTEILNTLHIN